MMKDYNYPFVIKLKDPVNTNLYIVNNENALTKLSYEILKQRYRHGSWWYSLKLGFYEESLALIEDIEKSSLTDLEKSEKLEEVYKAYDNNVNLIESINELIINNDEEKIHSLLHEDFKIPLVIYFFVSMENHFEAGFLRFPVSDISKYRGSSMLIEVI